MASRSERLVGPTIRLQVSMAQNLEIFVLVIADRHLDLAASMKKVYFLEAKIRADALRLVVSMRIARL